MMKTIATAAIATKQKAGQLRTIFSEVEDPRSGKPIHCLMDMIFIALCAAICGCDAWTDVENFGRQKQAWFRKFLSLKNGIPSHDTFSRVFGCLDSDQMCQALTGWLSLLGKSTDGQHIAIDGKSFRQSFDNASGTGMLHLVNAWSTDHGICFGQQAVDDKSNEISAVPKLLDMMQINGATITLDAMHCQHATAQQIIDRGADYVISVKGNQQTLASEIHQAFIDADESPEAARAAGMRMTVEQPTKRLSTDSRTRQIKRFCSVMPVPAKLRNRFPGIRSIVRMYREQQRPQKDGSVKETGQVTFFVSSLRPIVRDHAKLIRDHWKVEKPVALESGHDVQRRSAEKSEK